MMMEEVEALCGPRYRPTRGSAHRRAGTEKGVLRHGVRGKRSVEARCGIPETQSQADIGEPLRPAPGSGSRGTGCPCRVELAMI
jgi:hypothetical protein